MRFSEFKEALDPKQFLGGSIFDPTILKAISSGLLANKDMSNIFGQFGTGQDSQSLDDDPDNAGPVPAQRSGRSPAQRSSQVPAQRTRQAPAQPITGTSKSEIKPVQGSVTSNFGAGRQGRSHPGVDISAQSGTQIKAPISGQVTQAFMTNNDCGGTIAISNGTVQHRFCHCSKINVRVGQNVKQGDVVGLTGGGPRDVGRGHSTGPHLHWEKKLASGGLVNPMA